MWGYPPFPSPKDLFSWASALRRCVLLTLNMGRLKHAHQVSRKNGGAGVSKKHKRKAPIAKVPVPTGILTRNGA